MAHENFSNISLGFLNPGLGKGSLFLQLLKCVQQERGQPFTHYRKCHHGNGIAPTTFS